jgi:hypothetical protein
MHVGAVMSVLLVAALLAATASAITTGCIAYVLISFRRSGHLMASRVRRQRLALVLVTDARRQSLQRRPARRPVRWQPLHAS